MSTGDDRTIRDFGDQWSDWSDNEGYYGSLDLLADMLGPLLSITALSETRVADIGSGSGRIVRMLLEAGAEHVIAVEPSAGVEALRRNTRHVADRVEIIRGKGEVLPIGRELDFVFVIGVLPFVADPRPIVQTCFNALRDGGRIVVWLYAVEGTRVYRLGLSVLRAVAKKLPRSTLEALCRGLNRCLDFYIPACRRFPLPFRDYARTTLEKLSREKRQLTIFDQLNPSQVRFYRREELASLLQRAGFQDVQLHHRGGYSWTAIGSRNGREN